MKNSKYLSFLLSDGRFQIQAVILLLLLTTVFLLFNYKQNQMATLKRVQKEKEMVAKMKANPNADASVKLQGITHQDNKALALINGMIYEIGAAFGDYKLLEIKENSVVLLNVHTNQNKEIELSSSADGKISLKK